MRSVSAALLVLAGALATVPAASTADLPKMKFNEPKMKFNEVKQIAPGVFFRYSSISASDPKVPFGGSNHLWVVFQDYVVVIDANFPKEAGDVIAAIKKTTNKPIRYVFDTHHHGDHAYGNAVWAKEGASIIAQANCARLLRTDGPREFAEAGRGPTGRKDVAASTLKVPNVIFDDKLVLDDGTQRVEFLYMGHAHTLGDAVAYLPKHKILCTGDACVNGRFNYMGHSDSASWVRALEKMQQLDVEVVAPGHGSLARKDLLARQKRYFVELRAAVRKGLDADKELADVTKDFKPAWYKKWTGVDPDPDNVKHVHDELTGRVMPWDFRDDFDVYEGPSPTKRSKGWAKPKRIVVPSGLMPSRLADLKRIAPEVEFVPAKSAEAALNVVADADAVLGFATPELLKAGKKLRWAESGPDGVSAALREAMKGRAATLTDTQRVRGPQAADQALDLLLALRGKAPRSALRGQTMLVVGLGGAGMQIAKRGHAFGMRVVALDDRARERPIFVFGLDKLSKLDARLPQADVVVLACPLTERTSGLIGAKQLAAMKKTAHLINVGQGGLVDGPSLRKALEGKQLAGAGLADAPDEALRALPNVVVSATRLPSPEASERRWRLQRENVRRFVAGEPLLCVVGAGK